MRCSAEHPFHALPVLLALVNADADDREMGVPESAVVNHRAVAAKEIVAKLKTKGLVDLISKIDFVGTNSVLAVVLFLNFLIVLVMIPTVIKFGNWYTKTLKEIYYE